MLNVKYEKAVKESKRSANKECTRRNFKKTSSRIGNKYIDERKAYNKADIFIKFTSEVLLKREKDRDFLFTLSTLVKSVANRKINYSPLFIYFNE